MKLFSDFKKLEFFEKGIRGAFARIKEEFSDHLEAINENTNELQSHYEYLTELDNKIDKLGEKMEELQLMIHQIASQSRFILNRDEQKVFLLMYTLGEESPLSSMDIASRLNMTEFNVRQALMMMQRKGIGIIEQKIDDRTFYKLSKDFRELQAKEQLVKVEESLIEEIC